MGGHELVLDEDYEDYQLSAFMLSLDIYAPPPPSLLAKLHSLQSAHHASVLAMGASEHHHPELLV